jgi:hypothetical protein
VNFLFAIKLSSDFLQSSNIYKLYEKIIYAKFFVLSVSFTRPSTILPVVKENNMKMGTFDLQPQSDKVYQLLAHDPWFSLASSTTKTGCQDIAESGVKHNKTNNSRKLFQKSSPLKVLDQWKPNLV